ncbi:hypothetical protein LEP1GSC137_2137 [Leptospira borgpetersenii str. Noumea 25]|uniref:Uncharacterized protein n=1 Tax=Leptospira borgpetersenii serovar Ballum TaxID=280505 RepID=A0A0S2IN28_LEPBO|nr:hypothetical protein LBBP_00529 [Leptospira borgpetersenii serovar Ballum]ANG99930.1 Uncharacterized protein LB4E_0429 [Leptospira borgpetersenii str. 4E]EKR02172.1 hypothetical protein LEP1GSC121_0822 [Leptospira borgpetersenii serovar Castellonis str. 200801910]EMO09817.1 hypothetical protein LEP1GSC137_2137 [Leptospira borgpetersenii str. Noumea 25]
MVPKMNGHFCKDRSPHKIAPNPELSAFLKKIDILTFETNLLRYSFHASE